MLGPSLCSKKNRESVPPGIFSYFVLGISFLGLLITLALLIAIALGIYWNKYIILFSDLLLSACIYVFFLSFTAFDVVFRCLR